MNVKERKLKLRESIAEQVGPNDDGLLQLDLLWELVDSLVDECDRASCDLTEIAELLDGTFEPLPPGTDEGDRTYMECAYLIAKHRRTDNIIIEDVAEKLKVIGYQATVEYPGYIAIVWRGVLYKWGTANDTWMADLYHPDDDNEFGCIDSGVPSNCTDPQKIVDGLHDRMQVEKEQDAG